MENDNWNPLARPEAVVISTLVSESSTSDETGMGTPGPTINVRLIPLITRASGNPLGQREAEFASGRIGQLVRLHRAVGVTELPEHFGVADQARGQVIQPVALQDGVLLEQGEGIGRGHPAPLQIDDDLADRGCQRRRLEGAVAAVSGE